MEIKSFLIEPVVVMVVIFTGFADDPFKITTKRFDDRVEVKTKGDRALLIIRSLFGISSATIERTTDQWPENVVIQLRLKGLEHFKLLSDKLKLEASVSSHDGSVRLWKDGREDSPLDSKNRYWMKIKILDKVGKPTQAIPLEDGSFEMQLPKNFFEGNPKAIKLEWIDFYRI